MNAPLDRIRRHKTPDASSPVFDDINLKQRPVKLVDATTGRPIKHSNLSPTEVRQKNKILEGTGFYWQSA